MQLYLGGGKAGLCGVACRKTRNKCQSAKQISDMFFYVSLFRKYSLTGAVCFGALQAKSL
ncbi:hypothetical protein [Roseovarius marisflavi]|uniref:hypothetical protein n=1 Tax=Roseovarius marisflavi TaxID=1054996 RepID=UPI001114FD62|nr:hypothetical protein [Roseovarius marisflavi]